MDDIKFYDTFEAFRPHFDALARVAYYKIVYKSLSPIKCMMHKAFRIFVWIIVAIYNLQHVLRVVQAENTDQIVDTLFILLTTLNTLVKQIAFNARSSRIDHILSIIKELSAADYYMMAEIYAGFFNLGPLFAPTNTSHMDVMKSNAVVMRRLHLFYIGCIFTCGILWTIFPLVNKAWGIDVEFTGYFPFDTRSSPVFELTVAYMSILITLQAYGNVTMDCTIVAFYAQAKVQLQILRFNLEHLMDHIGGKDNIGKRNGKVVDKEFQQLIQARLVRCVLHHRKILWFKNEVESIFAEAMVLQILVMVWVICMTVYKIVGLSLFSAEFLSMAMYLCCMLAQFFIYCYYGTQVQYESEYVNKSAYLGSWLLLSPAFRRQLLVIMVACSRPIIPRTAYIIPISLQTYIAVLRASYTLFTFLDQKKVKK